MERKYLRSRSALESVEEGRIQLARLRREVRYLEGRCTAATASYDPKTGSGTQGPADSWAVLADRRKELEDLEAAQSAREQQVCGWIELLPKARWRMLLRARYLDGMDLRDVADTLEQATGRDITMHQVYRLHRQALDAAEEIWPM